MRIFAVALLGSFLCGGCLLNNINSGQKLSERVQEYSDATRWNRLDLAVHMVSPSYRDAFVQTHSGWGRAIEVADSEVLHIQMGADGQSATSTLAYSWYDLSAMTLARTVVRQTWDLRDGFHVMDELVIEGSPQLLPAPPPADESDPDQLASAP